MGLFTKKNTSNGLKKWLEEVDSVYTAAFETLNVSELSKYTTREFAMEVFEDVRRNKKVYSGLGKYRHVSWKKQSENDKAIYVIKEVKHDHIKVTRGIVAAVGVDYKEQWTLLKNGNVFILSDIRRL